MIFNHRILNTFCDYNSLENEYLRNSVLSIEPISDTSDFLKISRTFSANNYFDFIRFYNLASFIYGYRKPYIFSKANSTLVFSRMFKSKFLYFLLRSLTRFQRSSRGSFLKPIYFDSGVGMLHIREPHVAFSVTSPYFDYHTSRLSLDFTFLYRNNPKFLYKLVWLLGILPLYFNLLK